MDSQPSELETKMETESAQEETIDTKADANDTKAEPFAVVTRVCLVGPLAENQELIEKLTNLKIPYVTSTTGEEYMNQDDLKYETVFILEEFEGELFKKLKSLECRILSQYIINHVAATNQPIPYMPRPLYSTCMLGLTICFSNIKDKPLLMRLVEICHYMGAQIKKELNSRVQVMISNSSHGDRYRKAVALGTTVVRTDWIHHCWDERRSEVSFKANDDKHLAPYKTKPFDGCVLCFFGFPETEKLHMMDQARSQGADIRDEVDASCTHLVVEQNCPSDGVPAPVNSKMYTVVQEWFWGSIQIEAKAMESIYLYKAAADKKMVTRSSTSSSLLGTPRLNSSTTSNFRLSSGKNARKRLREATRTSQNMSPNGDSFPSKRPSTDLSSLIPDAMLDLSNTSAAVYSPKDKTPAPVKRTARYNVVSELLQTEMNYVKILSNIHTLFQKPLLDPNQAAGPILATEDVKRIFHPLPDIEKVHRDMSKEIEDLVMNWRDDDSCCVGNIVSKYVKEFQRHYPPFVNFFEERVNILNSLESSNSRFHAFLKINQAKRECGRQTLAELLINPVQRLPRMILLLQEIKKHTERENPKHVDVASIETAIVQFKEVTTHINEDKRKTESRHQLFNVVYGIQDFPPTLVSSDRQFVARVEAVTTDDNLCRKGENLIFFIFTDCVEIVKNKVQRGKYNTIKSPRNLQQVHTAKTSKHLKLLSLSHINRIANFSETESCRSRIAFYCQTPEDSSCRYYEFKIVSCQENGSCAKGTTLEGSGDGKGEDAKMKVIEILSKHRANTMCVAVDDDFVHLMEHEELEASLMDLTQRPEKKSSKLSQRLKHAFSFNKTPKRVIQRATRQQQDTPSPQTQLSGMERITLDIDEDPDVTNTSSLTPSMSVTSLCNPSSSAARRNIMNSTTSLMQFGNGNSSMATPTTPDHFATSRSSKLRSSNKWPSSNAGSSAGGGGKLKPAYSTMSLAVPSRSGGNSDFPAVPTPPPSRRRRLVNSAVKAASVALGRTSSLRRRNNTKMESLV